MHIHSTHSTVLTAIIIIEFALKFDHNPSENPFSRVCIFTAKSAAEAFFPGISRNLLSFEGTTAAHFGHLCKCERDDKPWMSRITKIHE